MCVCQEAAITAESSLHKYRLVTLCSPTHIHHFTCTISLNLFPVSSSSTFFSSFHIFGGLQHPSTSSSSQVLPQAPTASRAGFRAKQESGESRLLPFLRPGPGYKVIKAQNDTISGGLAGCGTGENRDSCSHQRSSLGVLASWDDY